MMYGEEPTYWDIACSGIDSVVDPLCIIAIFLSKVILAPLLFPFYLIGKLK